MLVKLMFLGFPSKLGFRSVGMAGLGWGGVGWGVITFCRLLAFSCPTLHCCKGGGGGWGGGGVGHVNVLAACAHT